MAMPAPAARSDWTAEEINALPDDGNRYEVVDGELLVSPAPTNEHQEAVVELLVRMRAYVIAASMQILVAPSAVRFSSRREVQPDLLVLPLVDGKRARSFHDIGRLELAVEILSPSTARADRYEKRALYQSERVSEYWIIDLASRLVERWRPTDTAPDVLLESLTWLPSDDVAPLVIDLVDYFRWVHGE
ncbi:MAG: Uma2 family endonuclease [Gemmatimonadaceae bacterium]|nr:Uma2 family endonuclease [Gemmatimonadaceae bacterium]